MKTTRENTAALARAAREINADHARAERAKTLWHEHARRAGERLLEVKRRVGHGNFMRWVEERCTCSYATANLYMKVAKHWDDANLERVQSLRQAKKRLQTRHRPDAPPLRRVADEYMTAIRQFRAAIKRAEGSAARLPAKVIRQQHGDLRAALDHLERLLENQAAA